VTLDPACRTRRNKPEAKVLAQPMMAVLYWQAAAKDNIDTKKEKKGKQETEMQKS
jgi:hypothetical protein